MLDDKNEVIKPIYCNVNYFMDLKVNKYEVVKKILEEKNIQLKKLNKLPIIINSPFNR